MSKQQQLIPNLNEIMEEYAGNEEEATPELQTLATQEERSEESAKTKQPPKESRKRKRNAEEKKTKQGEEEEAKEFVSNKAFVIIEKTMSQKELIGERGFNKLISPFREVIEKRGWSLLCEHKPAGFAAVVREFYANMGGGGGVTP